MARAVKTSSQQTSTETDDFFAALARHGHEPLLVKASGSLRFDLVEGERVRHWYVAVTNGDVVVSHKNITADAVARADRIFFDDLVAGRANATAALLRGVLVPEGDLGLLLLFQRLFPGPGPEDEDAFS